MSEAPSKARRRAPARRGRSAPEEAGPDLGAITEELLAVWDPGSWLTLPQLRQRLQDGWTLDDVGINRLEAASYVNKYNSVIVRTAKLPVPVKPSEAEAWVAKKMSWIAETVFKRASA